jgi:hypothetical protein
VCVCVCVHHVDCERHRRDWRGDLLKLVLEIAASSSHCLVCCRIYHLEFNSPEVKTVQKNTYMLNIVVSCALFFGSFTVRMWVFCSVFAWVWSFFVILYWLPFAKAVKCPGDAQLLPTTWVLLYLLPVLAAVSAVVYFCWCFLFSVFVAVACRTIWN